MPLLIAVAAEAGARDLDPTLSRDGKAVTAFGHPPLNDSQALGVALQRDGKIVAAGWAEGGLRDKFGVQLAIARYRRDGRLDRSFSGNGKVRTDLGHHAFDVAVQRDGMIVVVGQGDPTPNGALNDDSFALARYKPDGSLDQTFGADGEVMTAIGSHESAATAVGLQPDGKIVAAGWGIASGFDFALARYNPDGSLDETFGADGPLEPALGGGGDGIVTTNFGYPEGEEASDLALQPDGKIVVVGTGWVDMREELSEIALARYMPDGNLDPTFSGDGKLTIGFGDYPTEQGRGVAVQRDGGILIAGTSRLAFTLIRLLGDGSFDPSFGRDGIRRYGGGFSAADVVQLRDGGLVAAGESPGIAADFMVLYAKRNGAPDRSFSGNGVAKTDFFGREDVANELAVEPDGQVVLAGSAEINVAAVTRFALARFRAP